MKHDPGPLAALAAGLVIGVLYTEGGIFQAFAGLILLGVLIVPIPGHEAILPSLIGWMTDLLQGTVGFSEAHGGT